MRLSLREREASRVSWYLSSTATVVLIARRVGKAFYRVIDRHLLVGLARGFRFKIDRQVPVHQVWMIFRVCDVGTCHGVDADGSQRLFEEVSVGQRTTGKPMDMERKMGGKSMGMTTKTQARGDNPIYSRSADDLDGTEVVDSAGDKVGTIKHVVLMRDRHSAHAVISTGGMLGLGTRDIVVSLDEFNAMDDALQLNNTKEQIQARKEYQSEQYVELKGDKPIRAEFSAFEPVENAPDPALVPETPGSIQ